MFLFFPHSHLTFRLVGHWPFIVHIHCRLPLIVQSHGLSKKDLSSAVCGKQCHCFLSPFSRMIDKLHTQGLSSLGRASGKVQVWRTGGCQQFNFVIWQHTFFLLMVKTAIMFINPQVIRNMCTVRIYSKVKCGSFEFF